MANIARADSPRGELILRSRHEGAVLELRVNGVFVMDTQETVTEQALAIRALELVPDPRSILVGGLGLGFTAHALLGDVRVERVDVVEIERVLIDWMRDGTISHGPALLADQRLNVIDADIAQAVAEADGPAYDVVLLDVDNGPDHLVHEANERLYQPAFLHSCRRILHADGALAIWSASRSGALNDAMLSVFGNCEEVPYEVRLQERDEEYLLYTASRIGSGSVRA